MTDHLDRAAAIVGGCCSHCDDLVDERLALLASPDIIAEAERRGAVKALRAAAGTYSRTADYEGSAVISWLTDRADRIEREAGESDGDT